MRRSPLERKTPLRRAGVRRPKVNMVAWALATAGKPCRICGEPATDGHHVIGAQQLRRHHLEAMLADTRNHLALCRGCHGAHHNASRRILRTELKSENILFAAAVGLSWLLERDYPMEG